MSEDQQIKDDSVNVKQDEGKPEHLNLKVKAQDGNEVFFKVRTFFLCTVHVLAWI